MSPDPTLPETALPETTAASPSAVLMDEDNIGSVLSADVVYQLRKFRHDNTASYHRPLQYEAPTVDGLPADDREIYDLLLFAARNIGRDLRVPRSLEALRVVKLVPEDLGAAIFAKIEGHGSR